MKHLVINLLFLTIIITGLAIKVSSDSHFMAVVIYWYYMANGKSLTNEKT